MIRQGNEDCFLVADLSTGNVGLAPEVSRHRLGEYGSLLVVSDGMGGAVAGEIASDLSVKNVREELVGNAGVGDVGLRLRRAVEAANRAVWQYTQEHRQFQGMGATMTAVLCHESKAYIAQVGDSRAYLVRNGRIKQLTKDQSLVQLLIDSHAITPDQANQVPNNVILQALGTRPDVVVAMKSVELCRDDYVLLCSDGLSNKVTDEEMRDTILRNGDDVATACRQLIEIANARGGEDNITVIVARFDGASLQSATDRISITGSMQALTPDDLLRIGAPQIEGFQPPDGADASSQAGGEFGRTMVGSVAPSFNPNAITQVAGFTALPPENDDDLPDVVAPQMRPAPAGAASALAAPAAQPAAATRGPKHLNKILVAIALLLIGLALLAALVIVYFVFWGPGSNGD
jgi:protein phosphatase